VLDSVARAAVEMGIPMTPDFNTGDNTGVGYFHVNQKRCFRWSSARGFLKPVLHRSNLRLETGVLVEKVLFEGKRAVGIRYRQDGTHDRGSHERRGLSCPPARSGHPQSSNVPAWDQQSGSASSASPSSPTSLVSAAICRTHLQQRAIYRVHGNQGAQ